MFVHQWCNEWPYLLYAVARINSIFRKANITKSEQLVGASPIETEAELALARKLIGFITALAGLIWALHSLQNAGVNLNAFNPFYWARRRA